jgi:hypothetical protein
LDAINLGHRLSLPIEGDRVAGIRQTSGEFAPDRENCQTSADSVCSPFPSLARRAAEQDLPWRDAPWLVRLFTTLTFSHLLELSRIDDLTRRAFYELHCLKERWSVRELQRQWDSLLYERIGLSDKRDEILKLARGFGRIPGRTASGPLRLRVTWPSMLPIPQENPPVGILLCAERDAEVVRFATAGDGDVFVTRYQLELPTEDQLKVWLHEERARLERTGVDAQERK